MNKMKTIILATALTVLTFGAVAEELSRLKTEKC